MPDDRQREMHGFRGTLISGYTEAHSFDVAKKRLSKEGERQAKGQVKKKSDSNGSTNTNLGGESDGKGGGGESFCVRWTPCDRRNSGRTEGSSFCNALR